MQHLLLSEHGMRACFTGFASGADVCGGEWEESPWPHFSGNMWTAACNYIATLPPPNSLLPLTHSNWGAMEAWIGSGKDVLVWNLGSAYTGNKYIQTPKYDSFEISSDVARVATCIRHRPKNCRPEIHILAHVYHSPSHRLHVAVRMPCECVRHVTNDDVVVTVMMLPDSVFQVGVIRIDRSVEGGGPVAICSYSRLFPVVLNLKKENLELMGLNVMVHVSFDLGTHIARAQDARQVPEVLMATESDAFDANYLDDNFQGTFGGSAIARPIICCCRSAPCVFVQQHHQKHSQRARCRRHDASLELHPTKQLQC